MNSIGATNVLKHSFFMLLILFICASYSSSSQFIHPTIPDKNICTNTIYRKENSPSPSSILCKSLFSIRGGRSTTIQKTRKSEPSSPPSPKPAIIPINKNEQTKFSLMSLMMFLCIYIYTNVRDTKDTLIVTNCGAESIPFLKLYGVMPSATLFIILYSNLSNLVSKDILFYGMILGFLSFYMIFSFVLYPLRESIHVFFTDVGLESVKDSALSLLRYWSFSLYYIVSELWASMGVPLFFWSVSVFFQSTIP